MNVSEVVFFISSLIITLILVLIWRKFTKLRKHKQLFGWQVDWAEEQWDIIEKQKNLIEQKQNQIVDSINYAKKIQHNILQTVEGLMSIMPNSFILYKPKDIVSGDFYWYYKVEDQLIIVVADCTGHGVPGAFLSMIGSTLLNEIVIYQKVLNPKLILIELQNRIKTIFKSSASDKVFDEGMDISICRYFLDEKQLEFVGVNQNLFVVENENVERIEPQIKSLSGIFENFNESSLFNKKVKLNNGVFFFLTSDGFSDQIGGENNKKLKIIGFEKILLKFSKNYSENIKTDMNFLLNEWKNNNVQIDDILVLGIKV